MRIRTDDEYAHREDVIERAARFYDCNKTKAVVSACDDVPELVNAIDDVLQRDDLTGTQRQEIAERVSQCRAVNVDVETSVTVEKDP